MSHPEAVAITVGLAGTAVTPFLAGLGLRHLQRAVVLNGWFRLGTAVAGGAVGVAIAGSTSRGDASSLLPALLAWGWSLVALAACDAATRRIPTALVRQATILVGLLLVCGGAVSGDWHFVISSVGWSGATGAALLAAWRSAGAGAGDVRLAVLGGLGLTSTTAVSLLAGLGVWAIILVGQTAFTLARGGSLRTRVALGPGLAAGLLVAALLPG